MLFANGEVALLEGIGPVVYRFVVIYFLDSAVDDFYGVVLFGENISHREERFCAGDVDKATTSILAEDDFTRHDSFLFHILLFCDCYFNDFEFGGPAAPTRCLAVLFQKSESGSDDSFGIIFILVELGVPDGLGKIVRYVVAGFNVATVISLDYVSAICHVAVGCLLETRACAAISHPVTGVLELFSKNIEADSESGPQENERKQNYLYDGLDGSGEFSECFHIVCFIK